MVAADAEGAGNVSYERDKDAYTRGSGAIAASDYGNPRRAAERRQRLVRSAQIDAQRAGLTYGVRGGLGAAPAGAVTRSSRTPTFDPSLSKDLTYTRDTQLGPKPLPPRKPVPPPPQRPGMPMPTGVVSPTMKGAVPTRALAPTGTRIQFPGTWVPTTPAVPTKLEPGDPFAFPVVRDPGAIVTLTPVASPTKKAVVSKPARGVVSTGGGGGGGGGSWVPSPSPSAPLPTVDAGTPTVWIEESTPVAPPKKKPWWLLGVAAVAGAILLLGEDS